MAVCWHELWEWLWMANCILSPCSVAYVSDHWQGAQRRCANLGDARHVSRCGTETWPDLRLKWLQVDGGRLEHTWLDLTWLASGMSTWVDFKWLETFENCDKLAWTLWQFRDLRKTVGLNHVPAFVQNLRQMINIITCTKTAWLSVVIFCSAVVCSDSGRWASHEVCFYHAWTCLKDAVVNVFLKSSLASNNTKNI